MRIIFGTTKVTVAGTRAQLSDTLDTVKKIKFKARFANTGRMFPGLSDVSATVNGWELEIPRTSVPIAETDWIDFGEGSVKMNVFYVDASVNNDSIDWIAIVRS